MCIRDRVVQSDHEQKGKGTIRNLRELKLHEVSPVTFPANEEAMVTAVKADAVEGVDVALVSTDTGNTTWAGLPEMTQERFVEVMTEAWASLYEGSAPPATILEPSGEPEAPEKAALDTIEADAEAAEPDALPESEPLTEQATEAERLRIMTLIDLEESDNG